MTKIGELQFSISLTKPIERLPFGSYIRGFGFVGGIPTIWYEYDPEEKTMVRRGFHLVSPGHEVDEETTEFVGVAQEGQYVFLCYEDFSLRAMIDE